MNQNIHLASSYKLRLPAEPEVFTLTRTNAGGMTVDLPSLSGRPRSYKTFAMPRAIRPPPNRCGQPTNGWREQPFPPVIRFMSKPSTERIVGNRKLGGRTRGPGRGKYRAVCLPIRVLMPSFAA